jgi:hypothetical protein
MEPWEPRRWSMIKFLEVDLCLLPHLDFRLMEKQLLDFGNHLSKPNTDREQYSEVVHSIELRENESSSRFFFADLNMQCSPLAALIPPDSP